MPASSASLLERFDLESSTCYQIFFSNRVLPGVLKSQISALRVLGPRVLGQSYTLVLLDLLRAATLGFLVCYGMRQVDS